MENNIDLKITLAQLEYMIELATLDIALTMMKRDKMQTVRFRERLNTRIDTNRYFLNYLKAKRNEATSQIPTALD